MAHKAFIGPLSVTYLGGVPVIAITDNYVVLDSDSNLVTAPGGGLPIQVTVEFNYSDNQLGIKQRVLHAIRDAYGDQTIRGVFVNDLSGILNIL